MIIIKNSSVTLMWEKKLGGQFKYLQQDVETSQRGGEGVEDSITEVR